MAKQDKLSLDTLFGGAETTEDQVAQIDDWLIDEFPGHPYRLYTGKRHTDLLESIKEFGVLAPVILRSDPNGRYTLLAGYNRRHCNRLAGNKQLPAIIMQNVSDGDAKLIITHSNRQRGLDELLPSEKAFAFKMELEGLKETRRELKKVEAIEAVGKEVDCDLFQLEQMDFSRDQLAQNYDISSVEVYRFSRLTQLHLDLLNMVDENKIALRAAVALTYLSTELQAEIARQLTENTYRMDIEKAELLKARFKENKLDIRMITEILSGKETTKKLPAKTTTVKLQPTVIKRYFSHGESPKEIQSTIEKALKLYFTQKSEEA